MKIKYFFVTGESIEVEVKDDIAAVIMTIDHEMENNDRTETRRHNSLDCMKEEHGTEIPDDSISVNNILNGIGMDEAISKLLPQQQALIRKIYFDGQSISEVAREEGVGESAIRDRLKRIYSKLKIFLK